MKVLEIRGATGTSKILIGERIQNLPFYIPGGRAIFVTDQTVRRLFPDVFSGYVTIDIPAGEESKSLDTAAFVYGKLVELEADRTTFLVAVGGGVVSDVAGFAASTFLRGLDFGYVATTLLAQVDASVGGKTGVNFKGYKNMIGVIHQPRFVLCDPAFLATLPRRHFLSGMAEIVKHAVIGSPRLFLSLEGRTKDALELRSDFLEDIIYQSVGIKAAIVGRDEKEAGERRKLNFGHTLGHALEACLGISHGEAVGLGMVMAAELSARKGYLGRDDAGRVSALLQSLGLPTYVAFDKRAILDAVRRDKKRTGAKIKFVFLKGIGETAIEDLDFED
ncbi:MAG: 3-dehydroquinate synthase, partial [Candidatus Aminicenantales bacterium]